MTTCNNDNIVHGHSGLYDNPFGRRSSCCSYCEDNANTLEIQNETEELSSLTPPLENVFYRKDQDHPFSCIYLLNLFLAPDMKKYLAETNMSDDVYNLPVHFQKLLCEARMEVTMTMTKPSDNCALKRLENVRDYIRSIAQHDSSIIINVINELVRDEDELLNIAGE